MENSDDKDKRDLLIAVLAAGASSRMRGADKLLMSVRRRPLLQFVVERAVATGLPVCVTLPPAGGRWDALDGLDIHRIAICDAAEGMAASLRAVAAFAENRAAMICLADMPEIETSDMRAIIDAWSNAPDRVARGALDDGTPGQPVIVPAHLVPKFAKLSGDRGGHAVVADAPTTLVPLPDRRATTDLDTPEAWTEWRARTGIAD